MKIKSKSSREELEAYAMRFTPMDLNEDSIRAMVERCFATRADPEEDLFSEGIIPLDGSLGYIDPMVVLSKSRTEANKQNIQYLLGQLDVVHKGSFVMSRFPLVEAKNKYDGTQWAFSVSPIANLLIIGKILGTNSFCRKDDKTGDILVGLTATNLFPTISPKDPKFEEWYKNEYEPKMKDWKWQEV